MRVRTLLGGSDEVANHLLAGAPADLFLTADAGQLDRLEAAGLVEAGPRFALAGNSLNGDRASGWHDGRAVGQPWPGQVCSNWRWRIRSCPLGDYTAIPIWQD